MTVVQRNDAGRAFANIASAADLPILVPEERWKDVLDGDENPFYFGLTFPHKVDGTGGIYDGYHNEVAKKLARAGRPMVGSAHGHAPEGGIRGDVYWPGAKENADGSVTYKGYVPPTGVGGASNDWLKRLIRSGNAEFSIVANVTEGGDRQEAGVPVFEHEWEFPEIDLVEKGAQAQLVTNGVILNTEKGNKEKVMALENDDIAKIVEAVKSVLTPAQPSAPNADTQKTNDTLSTIRTALGLDEGAALSDITDAIQALGQVGSDAAAEELAGNAIGGKELNGKVRPQYEMALELIKAQPAYKRYNYAHTVLNEKEFVKNARVEMLEANKKTEKKENAIKKWW